MTEPKTFSEDELKAKLDLAITEAKKPLEEQITTLTEERDGARKTAEELETEGRQAKIDTFAEKYAKKYVAPVVLDKAKALLAKADDTETMKFAETDKEETTRFAKSLEVFEEILDKAMEGKLLVPKGETAPGDKNEVVRLTEDEEKEAKAQADHVNRRMGIKPSEKD